MRAAILALIVLATAGSASAEPARCHLEVDGRAYLVGMCNVDRDPFGGVSIGVGDSKGRNASPFFAYINRDDSGAYTGNWNGSADSTHAHDGLGTMRREGDCWINDRARVCATRR